MILSIIIPVYNVAPYLAQCLDSVVGQMTDDMEIVCVNDGSTDGSGKILQDYADKYKCIQIIDQANAGLSAARNTGLQYVTGKYIYFLDSDDYLYPNVLQQMVQFVEQNNLQMACFNVLKDGEQPYYSQETKVDVCTGAGFCASFRKQDYFSYVAPVWMYLYLLDFLQQHNLQFAHGRLHEDEEFTPRALYYADRIAILNIPIQYHRIKREGAITSVVSLRNLQHGVLNIKDLFCFIEQHQDFPQSIRDGLVDATISMLKKATGTTYSNRSWAYNRGFVNQIISILHPDIYIKRVLNLALWSRHKSMQYLYGNLPRWQCKLVRLLCK